MGKSYENEEEDIYQVEHPSHPHHWLRHQKVHGPYKCNGCKLPGFTACYKCQNDVCDFYLHEWCYQTKFSTPKTHTFMKKCIFRYHASPPRVANRYCDACGLDILGFRYECSTAEHRENPHDLHPTCAGMMDFEMDWYGLKLELRDKDESKCIHCGQRYPTEECKGFTGWKWVAKERDYGFPFCFSGRKICFHVKCMNEMMALKEKEFDECEMYHKYSIE